MPGTRRILVVSGEHQLWGFEMTREKEASMKITVDSYRDPFAALDLLSRQPGYDLVLVDIKMPSMNGLQFAKAARKADPSARIVLMMTAHAMEQDETAALIPALKVDAIVVRPVTLAAFSGLLGEQAPLIDAPA